jgi:hypothetical protein
VIDWTHLLANALWIFGVSVILATLSYASWQSSIDGEKFSKHLRTPNIQLGLNFGGFLFSAGLTVTTDIIWQKILWGFLSCIFLIQIASHRFSRKKE